MFNLIRNLERPFGRFTYIRLRAEVLCINKRRILKDEMERRGEKRLREQDEEKLGQDY